MTTYSAAAVTNSVIAYQKPITLQQGRALRDNPLSVAEADATAPASLLPTVLLGTLTTTSGSTQTLSGLVLTPYKFLRVTVGGVSSTAISDLRLAGSIISGAPTSSADAWSGIFMIDLSTGLAHAGLVGGNPQTVNAILSGYTTATTSISFSLGAGTFDAGTIRVYGEK